MKGYFEKNKKVFGWAILVIILSSTGIALIIGQFCMWFPLRTFWGKDDWASFLGSYVGGIATLVAVLLTIHYSRYEAQEKEYKLLQDNIRKSATIVYYDFRFAMKIILDANKTQPSVVVQEYKKKFYNLYLDSNWVRNVAELKASRLTSKQINSIYEFYGCIATIYRWVSGDNDLYASAKAAMDYLVVKETKDLKIEFKSIYSELRSIAEIDNSLSDSFENEVTNE